MRNVLFAVVLTVFLCEAQSFRWYWPKWGQCPDLDVQQYFDVKAYMGNWFAQKGYNIEAVQGKGKCVSAYYMINAENEIEVYNKGIALPSEKWVSINGTAVQADPSKNEGKLEVTFPIAFGFKVTGPYWVLGTDYYSSSVVYSCNNFFFFWHYYNLWLLSREQTMDSSTTDIFYYTTDKVLNAHNIDPSSLDTTIVQTDCYV